MFLELFDRTKVQIKTEKPYQKKEIIPLQPIYCEKAAAIQEKSTNFAPNNKASIKTENKAYRKES